MYQYDAQDYPYASKRHVVYAKNGMCCSGNPSTSSAGLQTLLKGGNAIDAILAMAASLPVVEPTGNGLGADCFAIIWYKG
ncbi:MAG: gamma-glutamyltransferase, partial [Sutterella sp.]